MTDTRFRWAVVLLLAVLVLFVARPWQIIGPRPINLQTWDTAACLSSHWQRASLLTSPLNQVEVCDKRAPAVGHWSLDIGPVHIGEPYPYS